MQTYTYIQVAQALDKAAEALPSGEMETAASVRDTDRANFLVNAVLWALKHPGEEVDPHRVAQDQYETPADEVLSWLD